MIEEDHQTGRCGANVDPDAAGTGGGVLGDTLPFDEVLLAGE